MELEEMAARLDAAEREIATLRAHLAAAAGEAQYAGQLLPLLCISAIKAGVLSAETVREALDRVLLRFEEGDGTFPGSREAFAYARGRFEGLLRLLPPAPPEPR